MCSRNQIAVWCRYAFIEYQHGGDMKKAYKAYPETGVCIGASERFSLVDVERGRTVQGWYAAVLTVFLACIAGTSKSLLILLPETHAVYRVQHTVLISVWHLSQPCGCSHQTKLCFYPVQNFSSVLPRQTASQ